MGRRADAPRVRTHRRTRPTRACPLAVGRYRAAFLVRIPFISVLPSAHGSKWLPGRTRRARTPRRCVFSSCVIEIPCDERTNERTTAEPRRRGSTREDARCCGGGRDLRRRRRSLGRVNVLTSRLTRACTSRVLRCSYFCCSSRRADLPEEDDVAVVRSKNQSHSLSSFPPCMAW